MSRALRSVVEDIGDLLAKSKKAGTSDYSRYHNDPVGFIRDVLHSDLYDKQHEIASAVRDHSQVTVRSCHAAGKDYLAARLALWWTFARRGLVVLTGPTGSQVEEILMRKEVFSAFNKGGLPGELHVRALRPGGTGEAGILARTGSAIHAMTGLHYDRVLFIITEAQDPEIEHSWDAAFACATGAEDRILTLGNPTEPDGRFYRAHQSDSGWRSIRIASDDIPNVQQARTIIPGLLTQEGVDRFIREYGADSPFVLSRVHAEFPTESSASLVTVAWLDRANERHRTGAFQDRAALSPFVLGCDPARLGPDRTVVCVRRGPTVCEFVEWRGLDTMQVADRVEAQCRRLLLESSLGVQSVHVDEIGLGGGVLDRLKVTLPKVTWMQPLIDRLYPTIETRSVSAVAFNAAKGAAQSERFSNMRAQAYWTLRKLLEADRLALPDLATLRAELLATRVRFAADGRTAIEPKEVIKERLGHSPDYADALVISLAPVLDGGKKLVQSWVR
jgi:phage terminase large subunit